MQASGVGRRRQEVPRRPTDINVESTERQLRKVLLAKSGEEGNGPPLLTVGGSVPAVRRPMSGASQASMIVHHPVDEEAAMTVKERVQAYLTRSVPELEAHINKSISDSKEQVRRETDNDLEKRFILRADRRRIFDRQTNDLRWENARRQELGRRVKGNMANWILEAIEGWDEKKAMQGRLEEEAGDDSQVMQEYVTKRAAHIDTGKLPTEIPIFKTLHSSYSLPTMWRDKYL